MMDLKDLTQARSRETRDTFWRTFQTFSFTRVVIVFVLLAYVSFDASQSAGQAESLRDWEICAIYLALAVAFVLGTLYFQKRFVVQLLLQIAVDIGAISMLYLGAGGASGGLAILYLFPLAGCAILGSRHLALFFVSVVTIGMLAESVFRLLQQASNVSISRAGLYGAAFFLAVFVLNRLAAKLIKQEKLAAQRGRALRIQEAINRLVIADMGDGILVVGRDGKVFAVNPAAERMLGLSFPYGQPLYKLTDLPSLAPIADAFFTWAAWSSGGTGPGPETASFVVVKPRDDIAALQGATTITRDGRREPTAHLKLRFATVQTHGLNEERAVIFLQDVKEIENQAQQLKLASMGRLTASIAHEVRNPLSAIAHAASLLGEEIADQSQARLLRIINDNAARLNRMIEDILSLSRKAHAHDAPLALAPFFAQLLAEFHETQHVAPSVIELGEMAPYQVWFDPLHLREVVVNLLTNALRYASGRPGSIRIHVVCDPGNRLELHVQDDGPAITPEIRSHLFEPFYTTSSKGTGLGLYLARELCLNNGAMLDYEYRLDVLHDGQGEPSGRFVITFGEYDPAGPR